ncbi:MAG: hypothetical protein M5U26_30430 [Planctomycetota bacterium]|nr:hypothetical protein [Planctomycetota bacterium]
MGLKAGARKPVYVEVLGQTSKVQALSADAETLQVSVQGNKFPKKWAELSAREFYSVASAYSEDRQALYEFCRGSGLFREAEAELMKR